MKYRLTDRELQKKLDEATDGEFSRRLQNDRERMDGMILIGCMGMIEDRRRHNHTKLQRMTLCFATDEIEEVAEYDPHGWNAFPKSSRPKAYGCALSGARALCTIELSLATRSGEAAKNFCG